MHAACNTRADPPHDINRTRACHPAHNRPKEEASLPSVESRWSNLSYPFVPLHHDLRRRHRRRRRRRSLLLADPTTTTLAVARSVHTRLCVGNWFAREQACIVRCRFDVTRYSLHSVGLVAVRDPDRDRDRNRGRDRGRDRSAVDDVVSAAATVKHRREFGRREEEEEEEEEEEVMVVVVVVVVVVVAKESCGKTEQ